MTSPGVQRLIADACLRGGDAGVAELAQRHDVSARDLAVLQESPRRLAVYRRLVRNNVRGVTAKMMPRTRARVNDAGLGAFDAAFDAFLEDEAPRTHYLRDVPAEFLAWVTPRWARDPAVPPFAADLAAYELVHFQVAAAPPLPQPRTLASLALDQAVVFCAARRLVRYGHAVHSLPDDEADRTLPAARDVALLVYRDIENSVRVLELSRLAAVLAEQLLAGAPLGSAVAAACRDEAGGPSEAVLASTASMLADWGERGLLLGAVGKVSGPSP